MATTTIPWGDGSGDNIYLTYSSASGNQTVEVTSDANTGAARSKVVTFTSGVGNITKSLTVSQERAVPSESRVQYLDNLGNLGTYIDTGVLSGNTIRIIVTASNMASAMGHFCGARRALRNSMLMMGTANSGAVFRADLGNTVGEFTINYAATGDTPKKYEINAATKEFYINDVLTKNLSNNTFSYQYNIHLFGYNDAGTHANMRKRVRIWSAQIYQGDTLVRDFVPYRVQQTGYMKDLVSGNLYGNSGSGDFTLGEDITL